MILNTMTSTWAQVGDFMIRSDGTTVQPVETDQGIIWTILSPTGEGMTLGTSDCVPAYVSVDSAMLVADTLYL